MPDRIGHYRIIRKLGEGGMGVVYAAEDERLGRAVAIKMIHAASADPRARERLWREARAAARVSHPNICQIYEIGEEKSDPYLVMELLDGEPLASRIARGPIPLAEAMPIAIGLLTALEALHRSGILHRDLKPSNVFLTAHGLKLLDFGLARPAPHVDGATRAPGGGPPGTAEPSLTLPGALVGTPRYMSPEQFRGEELDLRADVFAAGAIVFEMLAARPAFAGATLPEIVHAIMVEQPPALGGSTAIAAANRVTLRALAKRRDDRYQSAEAMAADLRAVLRAPDAGAAVCARPMTRLIVLPFRLARPDPDIDYLGGSLAEAITCSLSGLESLVVRSSLTAARFAGAAPDLRALAAEADVDTALTGSLLRTGDDLRVTAQLVEVPAGTLLWSHTAQVPLRDVFALENAVSRRLVESLAPPGAAREERTMPRDAPASPTAYEFYLRGTQQGHAPEHWAVARDLFLRSVEEDPRYAPAWARLARVHWLIWKYTPDKQGNFERAEEALRRALELNPDLSMAHNLYAHIEVTSGRALDAMHRLLLRARTQRSDPELFAGLVMSCRFAGLLDASVAAHEQARRLDSKIPTSITQTYFMMGEHERGLEDARFDIGYIDALHLVMLGRGEEALARLKRRSRQEVDSNVAAWVASIRALLEGRRADSIEALEYLVANFPDPEGMFYVARKLAHLGELERALEVLGRSVAGGYHCFPAFARDPWLDPLRARADFADLLLEAETRHRTAAAAFFEEGGDRVLGLAPGH